MANITVTSENSIKVEVVPTPRQTIVIDRNATKGTTINTIGGYPVLLAGTPIDYDALMFKTGAWTNINQTEISDGGNF